MADRDKSNASYRIYKVRIQCIVLYYEQSSLTLTDYVRDIRELMLLAKQAPQVPHSGSVWGEQSITVRPLL